MNTAIFPGTFDPFTIGHENIVRRGLAIFDKIVIGIGRNAAKKALYSAEQRKEAIEQVFHDQSRVSVVVYEGLTIELAKQVGARFILRGVRTMADFEYEQQMAAANRQLADIETVLLFTEPELAHISSSLLRDLHSHDYDISKFLPRSC